MLAVSHLVLATNDVPRITAFFQKIFSQKPYFEDPHFSEFVLPSRFRVAFFKPTGASAKLFSGHGTRDTCSYGVTVENVDETYAHILPLLPSMGGSVSGPPKEHPWGEKSFLLTDPDGNRWEITASPSKDGMLVNL